MAGLAMLGLSLLGITVDLGGLTTTPAVAAPIECQVTGSVVCSDRPPVARISLESNSGRTIRVCDRSVDPESADITRRWNFGDGATSTASCVNHTYERYGNYTVSLSVDDGTQSDSTSTRVAVQASGTPNAVRSTSGGGTTRTVTLPGEVIYRTRTVIVERDPAPTAPEDSHLSRIAHAPMVVAVSRTGLPLRATALGVLALLCLAALAVAASRRRARAESRHLEQAKEDFLSNVSHELRTPLTPVRGFAEILGSRTVSKEKARTYAASILNASVKLERVIDTLVDVAEIDAGRARAERSEIDAVALASEVLAQWIERHPEGTFRVSGSGTLTANRRLLSIAIDQLVDNAVKFSAGAPDVSISVTSDHRSAQISVTDCGEGISPRDQRKIFNDFRQADGSSTRTHGGLGLGLALVRRVAKLHGGKIVLRSAPGEGSTFTLNLPVQHARRKRSAAA